MSNTQEGMNLKECEEMLEKYKDWDIAQQSFSLVYTGKPGPADNIYCARRAVILAATNRIAELIKGEKNV